MVASEDPGANLEVLPAGAPLPHGLTHRSQANHTARDTVAQAWLSSKLSRHTRDAYRFDSGQYFRWCDFWEADVFRVTRSHIDAYRNHLVDPDFDDGRRHYRRPQNATINRKLTSVSSFYDFCTAEIPTLVPVNPVTHVARPHVSDEAFTVGLSIDEVDRVFAAAAARGKRDLAIVKLLAENGLRVAELCGADVADLGLESGYRTIRVTRKGGRVQTLPLSEDTYTAIRANLDGRTSGPLFLNRGDRISRQVVGYMLTVVRESANIEPPLSPHVFRHTAATLALNAGATLRDVQDMLGHRDPRTTNRYDRARGKLERSPVHILANVYKGAQ
jgi:site-specific recombinase XerD